MTWKRVATAVVLIPFVVGIVLWGSTAILALAVGLVTLLALFEYFTLGDAIGHRAYRFWTASCALLLIYVHWLFFADDMERGSCVSASGRCRFSICDWHCGHHVIHEAAVGRNASGGGHKLEWTNSGGISVVIRDSASRRWDAGAGAAAVCNGDYLGGGYSGVFCGPIHWEI